MNNAKVKQPEAPFMVAVVAGLTTFFTMSYILMVEPGMFSDLGEAYGVTFGAIFIATAIASAVGTFLIGWLADLPLAQAPGMGLNAFFVYTVCFTLGFSYTNALLFVLVDGLIFILLTATGLRRLIFEAIPSWVKVGISVGIGLFIAFLGLQDAGIVVPSTSTGVDLTSFNLLGGATLLDVVPKFITVLCVIMMIVLTSRKKPVPGAVLLCILGGTAIYYAFMTMMGETVSLSVVSPAAAFYEFLDVSWLAVFKTGFDFSAYLETHTVLELIVSFITTSLAFCMVDMFDTLGTLFGACKSGDLLIKDTETGELEVPNMNQAMMADAVATFIGALLGVSTVTTYVESSAGVGAGGKNRVSAYVTSLCFLIAIFFAPLASIVPSCAYAAALVFVGFLMFKGVKDWEWDNTAAIAVGFITAALMPFTYNISYGICFGLVFYVFIKLFRGKAAEIKPATWIITLLFVMMLLTAR